MWLQHLELRVNCLVSLLEVSEPPAQKIYNRAETSNVKNYWLYFPYPAHPRSHRVSVVKIFHSGITSQLCQLKRQRIGGPRVQPCRWTKKYAQPRRAKHSFQIHLRARQEQTAIMCLTNGSSFLANTETVAVSAIWLAYFENCSNFEFVFIGLVRMYRNVRLISRDTAACPSRLAGEVLPAWNDVSYMRFRFYCTESGSYSSLLVHGIAAGNK